MRRINVLSGVVLAAAGAVSIVEALRVRDDWLGAKLMPAVVGGALIALGLAHLIARLDAGEWPGASARWRVAFVFAGLTAYVVALPELGFLPATAAFVLVLVRWLGAFSWPATLVLTGVIAGAGHLVFRHWLGMPLPPGVFGL